MDICKELLQRNKLKIHLEIGNIYHDNQNTNKSIYDIFLAQEDPTKKPLNTNLKRLIITVIVL